MDPMSLLWSVLRIAIGVYLGLLALLWLFQERLLFYPQPLPDGVARMVSKDLRGVTELEVDAGDGVRLRGWLRHTAALRPAPLVIYFGGNAEEVSGEIVNAEHYAPFAVATFNYRGYGASEGKPGQRALFADALEIFDRLVARPDIDPARVVVVGRSLGSGVAVHLAAERRLAGVILVSPYDSVRSVAQDIYPLVPIGLLLRHPFDSMNRAPTIEQPALVLAALEDATVPARHSERLYQAWGGPKRLVTLPGVGHGNIEAGVGYWPAIEEFLRDRLGSSAAAGRDPPATPGRRTGE